MTVFSLVKNVNNVSLPIFSQGLQTTVQAINNQSINNSLIIKNSKIAPEINNNFIKFAYPFTIALALLFFSSLVIGSVCIVRQTLQNENLQNNQTNNPSNMVNNPNIDARIGFMENNLV